MDNFRGNRLDIAIIWQEDSATEQARLGFVVRLLEENHVRYREQSKLLLKNREFWHDCGETILVYSLEYRDIYRVLEFQFAHIEARWDHDHEKQSV